MIARTKGNKEKNMNEYAQRPAIIEEEPEQLPLLMVVWMCRVLKGSTKSAIKSPTPKEVKWQSVHDTAITFR
jgi:hypothetical protein